VRAAHPQPPSRSGVRDGLAYDLFLPPDVVRSEELATTAGRNPVSAPRSRAVAEELATTAGRNPVKAGVVILHGAGSSRLSHLEYARRCARHGFAAIAFDLRGHGESAGALDGGVLDDVAAMAALLPPAPLVLRGSSMGGYLALVAGAALGAAAVVAVCPATGAGLRRGLRAGEFGFAADRAALESFLDGHDAQAAARALGERLLLLHAEGDEVVPVMVSRELHAAAPASRLVVVPGGHHRSAQHDPELQDLSVRFVAARVATWPPSQGGPTGSSSG
jgi:pimeloyl-ACP methyl ester carboxylesterase